MLSPVPRSVWTRSALLALVVLGSPSDGVAEPRARFPIEQPVALSARVALLEERVHTLQERLSAFAQVGLKSHPAGGFTLDAHGAQVIIDPSGKVVVVPAAEGNDAPGDQACEPPYWVDERGVRSIKPQCLKVGRCDPPFTVRPDGVRRPKPNCP